MKARTLTNRLVIAAGFGAALLGVTAYSAAGEACWAGKTARPESSVARAAMMTRNLLVPQPAAAGDAVMEWNQQAATRTLTVAPALAPVQQTRVMAIIQVAVHDAVN